MKLKNLLKQLDHSYFADHISLVPDATYEALKLLYKKETGETWEPEITEGVIKGEKVKHRIPMLSLQKAHSEADVLRITKPWAHRGVILQPKVDGMSLSLFYRKGILVQALTRGNGTTGTDVTRQVLFHGVGIPHTLPEDRNDWGINALAFDWEIRGEAVILKADFEEINRSVVEPFKNARNLVCGTIGGEDFTQRRKVSFIAYDYRCYYPGMDIPHPDIPHTEKLVQLSAFGFAPVETQTAFADECYQHLKAMEQSNELQPYATDGSVVKLTANGNLEGFTAKYPKGAFALKYKSEEATTRLLGVTFQIGRTGKVTPVAELEPVELDGTEVSRATLNNEDYIIALGIRIGDTVKIHKAGEIIPEIIEVDESERPPESKPFSFEEELKRAGITAERRGKDSAWYLTATKITREQAEDVLVRRVTHFFGKSAVNALGMGPEAARALVKAFKGHLEPDQILTAQPFFPAGKSIVVIKTALPGRTGENLYENMRKTRETATSDKVLHGLGIAGLGSETCKLIVGAFNLREFDRSRWTLASLTAIDGIGTKTAEDVLAYLDENPYVFADLRRIGFAMPDPEKSTGGPLQGKTLVFTGELSMPRPDAKKLAEAAGAKVTSSVSAKTDYLVVGLAPGSKYDKAKEIGVEIIDETAFRKLTNHE